MAEEEKVIDMIMIGEAVVIETAPGEWVVGELWGQEDMAEASTLTRAINIARLINSTLDKTYRA